MTTSKAQKVRIALFTIAAGVLLALVLILFAGLHFWKDRTNYRIVFEGSVYGLQRGADVYYNGVRVGTVHKIRIDPTNIENVDVDIEVDAGAPVKTDTKAFLRLAGITGLKVIDLRDGTMASSRLAANGQIPVGKSTLDELEEQGKKIVNETQKLMEKANDIAVQAEQVVSNLSSLTDPSQMGALIEQTKHTAANLSLASASLRGLVEDNRASLKASLASVELAAKRAAELVDNGQLRSAVSDLRQASRSFKELARDVRQKPSRLIYSNPAPDRKLP